MTNTSVEEGKDSSVKQGTHPGWIQLFDVSAAHSCHHGNHSLKGGNYVYVREMWKGGVRMRDSERERQDGIKVKNKTKKRERKICNGRKSEKGRNKKTGEL